MELFSPQLIDYCQRHTTPEDGLLKLISRETHAKVLMPRMLSGHLQGKTLEFFSKMIQPQYILEIGTFTGYATLCLARGLAPGGKLTTLDINAELEGMVRDFFAQSGISSRIEYRIGNALDIIPQLEERFDMVFIDADKTNYINYYQMVVDKVNPGGIILADNALWSGKVLGPEGEKISKDTQAILDFNQMVQNDARVENVLFPIRDGMMMARKL